jgi:hypothetical protein
MEPIAFFDTNFLLSPICPSQDCAEMKMNRLIFLHRKMLDWRQVVHSVLTNLHDAIVYNSLFFPIPINFYR